MLEKKIFPPGHRVAKCEENLQMILVRHLLYQRLFKDWHIVGPLMLAFDSYIQSKYYRET